jgi:hypothetical protein
MKEITNSHASTYLFIETPGRNIHWMEPADFDATTFKDYFEKHWSGNSNKSRRGPALCRVDALVVYNNQRVMLKEFAERFAIRKGQRILGLD